MFRVRGCGKGATEGFLFASLSFCFVFFLGGDGLPFLVILYPYGLLQSGGGFAARAVA